MKFEKLCENLCRVSEEQALDYNVEMKWPEAVDLNQWFMTPELISLYGMDIWNTMSEEDKKKLSFYEAVNFFGLNIHGERHIMSKMARLLYDPLMKGTTSYLHHFLDEENKHSTYFGKFCTKYAGKIYPDTNMDALPKEYEQGEEEFLYFAKVMLFEESFDRYNVTMSKDDRVIQIVRDINRCHHIDESRHLAFGRVITKQLFDEYSPKWSPETLASVRRQIVDYMESFWRDLFCFRAYKDAGLPGDPLAIRDAALKSPRAEEHYKNLVATISKYFVTNKMLESEPKLASMRMSA